MAAYQYAVQMQIYAYSLWTDVAVYLNNLASAASQGFR